MPIYTKKGDGGETGTFDGKRVAKNDKLIEAIGAVDELNAQIGAINGIKRKLEIIQNDLFGIGARLAGYEAKLDLEKRVAEMEQEIDRMWRKLPPLKNFVLPSGQLHLARTVARRAERAVVALGDSGHGQNDVKKYLNRLSDYLFCLARWVNWKNKIKETVWRG